MEIFIRYYIKSQQNIILRLRVMCVNKVPKYNIMAGTVKENSIFRLLKLVAFLLSIVQLPSTAILSETCEISPLERSEAQRKGQRASESQFGKRKH